MWEILRLTNIYNIMLTFFFHQRLVLIAVNSKGIMQNVTVVRMVPVSFPAVIACVANVICAGRSGGQSVFPIMPQFRGLTHTAEEILH